MLNVLNVSTGSTRDLQVTFRFVSMMAWGERVFLPQPASLPPLAFALSSALDRPEVWIRARDLLLVMSLTACVRCCLCLRLLLMLTGNERQREVKEITVLVRGGSRQSIEKRTNEK